MFDVAHETRGGTNYDRTRGALRQSEIRTHNGFTDDWNRHVRIGGIWERANT